MKDTKENKVEKIKEKKQNNENNKIEFASKEESEDFKQIAKGRKFCKKGERIQDIYDEELERYNYENNLWFFAKLFKRRKYNKQTKRLMIENKRNSVIRSFIFNLLRQEENTDKETIIKEVKKIILENVNLYEKNN